jgi:type I restriction enzyme S subunit
VAVTVYDLSTFTHYMGRDRYMEPIRQKEAINGSQINTLVALRDTLLPKLLSGELRVREAERLAEEQL